MRSIGAASSGASSGIPDRFHRRELFRNLLPFLSPSLFLSPSCSTNNAPLYILFRHFSIIMHRWLFLGLFRGPIDRNGRFRESLRSVLRRDREMNNEKTPRKVDIVAAIIIHVLLLIFKNWCTYIFIYARILSVICLSHKVSRLRNDFIYYKCKHIYEKINTQREEGTEETRC